MFRFFNLWIDHAVLGLPLRFVAAPIALLLIVLVFPMTLWETANAPPKTVVSVIKATLGTVFNTFILLPIFFLVWAITGKAVMLGSDWM